MKKLSILLSIITLLSFSFAQSNSLCGSKEGYTKSLNILSTTDCSGEEVNDLMLLCENSRLLVKTYVLKLELKLQNKSKKEIAKVLLENCGLID